jgi:hypothetical protein
MWANGVRTMDTWCSARGCNHHSIVDVNELADDVPVPSIDHLRQAELEADDTR